MMKTARRMEEVLMHQDLPQQAIHANHKRNEIWTPQRIPKRMLKK